MRVRVVIAHHSDLLTAGAQSILETASCLEQVATVTSGEDLLGVMTRQRWDIILLDERLDPGHPVFHWIACIRQAQADARILVVGSICTGLFIRDLLAHGVQGYLYESDSLAESLVTATEVLMRGRIFLSVTANAEYLVTAQSPERVWKLDPQAREVLRLLACGLHVGQIAVELGLTVGRIYEIRRKLRRCFNVETNEHLIMRAVEEGFSFPDG